MNCNTTHYRANSSSVPGDPTTGSTGLLGSNLVRELVDQGYTVKALVRSVEKAKHLLGDVPQVQFVQGNLQNIAAFAHELKGCDVLFHAAAFFREYYQPGDHWQTLKRLNVDATVELLEAAEKAGMRKAIYVSSSGCIGNNGDGSPGSETTPPGPLTHSNLYFKSKLMAEAAVANFLQRSPLPVVLICPGAMFGPQDAAPTDLGQFVLDYLHRKLPGLLSGGLSAVDARDVALAMVAAVERGRSGDRYLVAGRYHSMADLMHILERVSGVPAPRRNIPGVVVRLLAWFSTWTAQLMGRKPDIPIEGVKVILAALAYDSAKAQRELGIQFRPLEVTLSDQVAWYRQANYL